LKVVSMALLRTSPSTLYLKRSRGACFKVSVDGSCRGAVEEYLRLKGFYCYGNIDGFSSEG